MLTAAAKTPVAEGQRGEVGHHVEAGVVPGGVAHGEIHAAVALGGEQAGVLAFAGAGVEHARVLGKAAREGFERLLDGAFEVQHVAAQRAREERGGGGVPHFFRASTITVEPARQAASSNVNGSAAATRAK